MLLALNSAAVRITTEGRFDDKENFNNKSNLSVEFELNKSEFTENSAAKYDEGKADGSKNAFKSFSKYFCLAYVDESTKRFNCVSR
jgi:hypothetical protein